jgi:hypothetical protein
MQGYSHRRIFFPDDERESVIALQNTDFPYLGEEPEDVISFRVPIREEIEQD